MRVKWEAVQHAGNNSCKNAAKTETLALSICFPKDWEKKMVSSTRTVTRVESKSKKKRKFYKGELIQIHGHQEAMEFINKGKYKD